MKRLPAFITNKPGAVHNIPAMQCQAERRAGDQSKERAPEVGGGHPHMGSGTVIHQCHRVLVRAS